ncbi:MAG: hypothetical protein AB1489_21375 [Acidobacteriota bacterium]
MVVSVIVILGNHSYRCAYSVGMLSVWYEYREKLPGFIKKLLGDKWLRDNIEIWSSRNNQNNMGMMGIVDMVGGMVWFVAKDCSFFGNRSAGNFVRFYLVNEYKLFTFML